MVTHLRTGRDDAAADWRVYDEILVRRVQCEVATGEVDDGVVRIAGEMGEKACNAMLLLTDIEVPGLNHGKDKRVRRVFFTRMWLSRVEFYNGAFCYVFRFGRRDMRVGPMECEGCMARGIREESVGDAGKEAEKIKAIV